MPSTEKGRYPVHRHWCATQSYDPCDCGVAARDVKRRWNLHPAREVLGRLVHAHPRVALVSCCQEKADEKLPAGLLYTSPLFRLSLEYASRCCDIALILSAKHGLLEPHEEIKPYDMTVSSFSVNRYLWWSALISDKLRELFPAQWTPEFVVLAGEQYVAGLKRPGNWDWVEPLTYEQDGKTRGMGIGQRLSFLRNQVDRVLPRVDPNMAVGDFRCACGAWEPGSRTHAGTVHGYPNPRGGRPVCASCRARIGVEVRA